MWAKELLIKYEKYGRACMLNKVPIQFTEVILLIDIIVIMVYLLKKYFTARERYCVILSVIVVIPLLFFLKDDCNTLLIFSTIYLFFIVSFYKVYKASKSLIYSRLFPLIISDIALISWTIGFNIMPRIAKFIIGINYQTPFILGLLTIVNFVGVMYLSKMAAHIINSNTIKAYFLVIKDGAYHKVLLACLVADALIVANVLSMGVNDYLYWCSLVAVILISFLLTIMLKLYLKNTYQNYELASQLALYTKVQEENEQTDRFKHDYKNLMTSLYLLIEQGENQKALTLISQLENYGHNAVGSDHVKALTNIPNLYVKSLFYNKIAAAENEGIPVNVRINAYTDQISMGLFDYVRSLGILLDNATEAEKDFPVGEGLIKIDVNVIGGYQIVTIKNKGAFNIDAAYKSNGYGLLNINQICKQYSDCGLNIEVTQSEFIVTFSVALN
ncbi:GHKL domain-containing protein [Lactobacillus curvatus]|nr:GHKL domain-containing protein [Latilactobacillus curvatus]MSE24317.1 GHKL domain-containing protein [Latilactobacillus curvatus]